MEMDDYLNLHLNLAELGLLEHRAPRHNLLDLVEVVRANQVAKSAPVEAVVLNSYAVIHHQDLILKYGEYMDTVFNPLIHEAFVGWFGTNQLQSPHFAPILGFQRGPALSGHPETQTYCVAYKYIPGVTLHRYLKTATSVQIKSILKQLGAALEQAWTELDFTHYDLHLRNIIITEGSIPVLIDYGVAHIRYGALEYGCRIESAAIGNRSRWFYDWFKVLMSLYGYLTLDRAHRARPKIQRARLQIKQIESEGISDSITMAQLELYQKRIRHWEDAARPLPSAELAPAVIELLQFFGGAPMTPTGYREYQACYQYLEPSRSMLTQTYSLDSFLELLAAQMK